MGHGTQFSFRYSVRRKMLSKPVSQDTNGCTRILPAALGAATNPEITCVAGPCSKQISFAADATIQSVINQCLAMANDTANQVGFSTADTLTAAIAQGGKVNITKVAGLLFGGGPVSYEPADKVCDKLGNFSILVEQNAITIRQKWSMKHYLAFLMTLILLVALVLGGLFMFTSVFKSADVAEETPAPTE